MVADHNLSKLSKVIKASVSNELMELIEEVRFNGESDSRLIQIALYRLYLHRKGKEQIPEDDFPEYAQRRTRGPARKKKS